jgi:hypothetical protein
MIYMLFALALKGFDFSEEEDVRLGSPMEQG